MDRNKAPRFVFNKNKVYYCEKCKENTQHKHYTRQVDNVNYPMVKCMRCKLRTALYWKDDKDEDH